MCFWFAFLNQQNNKNTHFCTRKKFLTNISEQNFSIIFNRIIFFCRISVHWWGPFCWNLDREFEQQKNNNRSEFENEKNEELARAGRLISTINVDIWSGREVIDLTISSRFENANMSTSSTELQQDSRVCEKIFWFSTLIFTI